MVKIGRRIAVYGPTCSGKSTVSKHISKNLRIPHIELDAIFWTPGWVEMPTEDFRAEVSTLLNKYVDSWVCDGNYSRVRDLILPLADTVIWLRLPFRIVFWRVLKRTINRCRTGELLWGTNRESWRSQFLSRESLILYTITHFRRQQEGTRQALEETPNQASILQLRSLKEINAFLASLLPISE